MANPIIILGAGASYDYSPYIKPSPLTNELVKKEFLASNLLDTYKEAASLLSDIAKPVLDQEKSFEEALGAIKKEFGSHPHRQVQFISLEFYLQDLFRSISSATHPINNYRALVNKIRDNGGNAHVVSFNYDTLFEESVDTQKWQDINSYIRGSIKLIKPHGSHDWVFVDHRDSARYQVHGSLNDYEYYKKIPDNLEYLRQKDAHPYHVTEIEKAQNEGVNLIRFPAIAVPLPDKQSFVCPRNHITELGNALKNTDRILIIGWKAGDPNLIELMTNNISQEAMVYIVSDTEKSANETRDNLSHIPYFKFKTFDGKFSGFVTSDQIKEFFV